MCYGTCRYETSYDGECSLMQEPSWNGYIPDDAFCMKDAVKQAKINEKRDKEE